MSYFAFWLGELVMGTSAVLAVVVMGLYMNAHKSAISPPVLHFLHEFYEMVAHFLNTIIFFIAGAKLGALANTPSFFDLWRPGSKSLTMIVRITEPTHGVLKSCGSDPGARRVLGAPRKRLHCACSRCS